MLNQRPQVKNENGHGCGVALGRNRERGLTPLMEFFADEILGRDVFVLTLLIRRWLNAQKGSEESRS